MVSIFIIDRTFDILEHLAGVAVLCLAGAWSRTYFLFIGFQSEINPDLRKVLENYYLVAAASNEFDPTPKIFNRKN